MCLNETYHDYLMPVPHDTDQDHEFKDQGHQQHFPKMHFSGGDIPITGFPLKTV